MKLKLSRDRLFPNDNAKYLGEKLMKTFHGNPI